MDYATKTKIEELQEMLKNSTPELEQLAEIQRTIDNTDSRIQLVSIQKQLVPYPLLSTRTNSKSSPLIYLNTELPSVSPDIKIEITRVNQCLLDVQQKAQIDLHKVEASLKQFNDLLLQVQPILVLYADLYKEISRIQKISNKAKAKTALLSYSFVFAYNVKQSVYNTIVELHESDERNDIKERKIEEVLLGVFTTEVLENIRLAWLQNDEIADRIPILNECLIAYRGGQYNVCIPPILAQTEGLIAKHFNHQGPMSGAKYEKYISRLCAEEPDPYVPLLEDFISQTLLEHFEHGQAAMPKFSRHAILHGGDVHYGTAANVLRAILMFDYVQGICLHGQDL